MCDLLVCTEILMRVCTRKSIWWGFAYGDLIFGALGNLGVQSAPSPHQCKKTRTGVCACVCVPKSWSQDAITNDKVKFLQVGSWPVLQHAITMETITTLVQAFGDLKYIPL